jgi:hypothetical protein
VTLPGNAGLVVVCMSGDRGYLHFLGSAPSGVDLVEAVSSAGPVAIANVVRVSTGDDAQLNLFAVTLYAADRSLESVRLDGRDTSGRVVVTRTTDEWAR